MHASSLGLPMRPRRLAAEAQTSHRGARAANGGFDRRVPAPPSAQVRPMAPQRLVR
jgi:hypothetical protein